MKRIIQGLFCFLLALGCLHSVVLAETDETSSDEVYEYSDNDRIENTINMLNYLAVISQEINSNHYNRLYLEEAYSALINNLYPNAVDEETQAYVYGLLDKIDEFKMINTRREQIDYLYEQNKASAMKSFIPDSPGDVVTMLKAVNVSNLSLSVVSMPMDMYQSYEEIRAGIEAEYLQQDWELSQNEEKTIAGIRKDLFSYMVDTVRNYGIDGNLTLNEDAVKKYAEMCEETNSTSRVRYLERNADQYAGFSDYWLLLGRSYFENGKYKETIEAISKYENLNLHIFRRDRNYAEVIPLAIASAKEVYDEMKYVQESERYLNNLLNNIDTDDWEKKYYAAVIYSDLYSITKDKKYLQSAYAEVLDNVSLLVDVQRKKNEEYLANVKELKVPNEKDTPKDEKESIKNYNKVLNNTRKTELPPVYEPLLLNCELLFTVAKELKITSSEKNTIDSILHNKNKPLFLIKTIDDLYWFNHKIEKDNYDVRFDGDTLTIPAKYLSSDYQIDVTVINGSSKTVYSDWKIDKVERGKKTESTNIETHYAQLSSKDIKKAEYTESSKVKVVIQPKKDSECKPIELNFSISEYRKIGPVITKKFEMK